SPKSSGLASECNHVHFTWFWDAVDVLPTGPSCPQPVSRVHPCKQGSSTLVIGHPTGMNLGCSFDPDAPPWDPRNNAEPWKAAHQCLSAVVSHWRSSSINPSRAQAGGLRFLPFVGSVRQGSIISRQLRPGPRDGTPSRARTHKPDSQTAHFLIQGPRRGT